MVCVALHSTRSLAEPVVCVALHSTRSLAQRLAEPVAVCTMNNLLARTHRTHLASQAACRGWCSKFNSTPIHCMCRGRSCGVCIGRQRTGHHSVQCSGKTGIPCVARLLHGRVRGTHMHNTRTVLQHAAPCMLLATYARYCTTLHHAHVSAPGNRPTARTQLPSSSLRSC